MSDGPRPDDNGPRLAVRIIFPDEWIVKSIVQSVVAVAGRLDHDNSGLGSLENRLEFLQIVFHRDEILGGGGIARLLFEQENIPGIEVGRCGLDGGGDIQSALVVRYWRVEQNHGPGDDAPHPLFFFRLSCMLGQQHAYSGGAVATGYQICL